MSGSKIAPGGNRTGARESLAKTTPSLRVLLYIGRFRVPRHPDVGLELFRKIRASRHTVAGVILLANDPLVDTVSRLGVPLFPLLPELDLPFAHVKQLIKDAPPFRQRLSAWLGRLKKVEPDIGVVFGGNWVPPGLSHLPPRGFINYHLAPLPELRGFESDTFAVLEGRTSVWGTVHLVSNGYDEGPIIARSARVRLHRYTTPVVVLHALFKRGPCAVVRALDLLTETRGTVKPQDSRQATDASRDRARRESVIRWDTDDATMLQRRLLAFCGQDIPIRLKADLARKRFCVRDLEIYRGRFPGRPGDVIGAYQGKGPWQGRPIVRTTDGAAVMEVGSEVAPGTRGPEEPLRHLLPPRRRRRVTTLRGLRASLT